MVHAAAYRGGGGTGEWLTTADAGRLLGMDPSSVAGWARDGRLAGSERRDGRWIVRRSEVERVLAEREQAGERRMAKWRPMTERPEVTAVIGRARCEAETAAGTRCSWSSAGPVELAVRPVELCPFHGERARRWGDTAVALHGRAPVVPEAAARGRRWSAADEAYLRVNPDAPAGMLATHLGRTVEAVAKRRSVLRREGRA